MNNTKTYSKTSIALHWIVGLAFIGVFIIGAIYPTYRVGQKKWNWWRCINPLAC